MTQQEFENACREQRKAYERKREALIQEREALQELKQQYHDKYNAITQRIHITKTVYKNLRQSFIEMYQPEASDEPNKVLRRDCFSLQRHISYEIERFCEGKEQMNAEGKSVKFDIQENQVVYTITIPKKQTL